MSGNLEGKVVIVTGGGDGIGRECALAYARDNATVAILDKDLTSAKRTAAELSSPGLALQLNVSDGAAVKLAIAAVLKEFARIDAVHNNAGIATPSKPLHETTEEEWDNLQRNNLKSVYWTTRYAFEALRATKARFLTRQAWSD